MEETNFDHIASDTLHALEDALSEIDEHLDVGLSMGVLTIEFEDGGKYVINSHRAARQIWMAAGPSAWHFDWDGKKWVAQKTKDELWSTVTARVSERLGRPIALAPAELS